VRSAWRGVGRLSGNATMALVVVASCGPMAPAGHRSFETTLSGDSLTTGLRVVTGQGCRLVGVLRRITVRLSQFQPSTRFRVSGP
jgi:hypothetical protein